MRSPFTGLRFARLELNNYRASTMMKIAVCIIALIPLVYGGVFLLAFFDPYGSLDQVPAAIVNLDQGDKINGDQRNVGHELCKQLVKNNEKGKPGQATGFDWKFLNNVDEARKGLDDGTYYMELIIPKNFTKSIGSAGDEHPERAELHAYFNPSTNLIAQTIGANMVTNIRQSLNNKIGKEYFNNIFLKISDSAKSMDDAVDGAGSLASGAGKLENGSSKLGNGIQTAKDGSGSLESGLGKLQDGSGTLTNGIQSAKNGANKLADGSGKLQNGSKQLGDGIKSAKDGAGKLEDGAKSAKRGADQLASGAKRLSDGAKKVDEGVDSLSSNLKKLQQGIADGSKQSASLSEALTGVGDALQSYGKTQDPKYLTTATQLAAKVKQSNSTIGDELYTDVTNLTGKLSSYQKAATDSAKAEKKMDDAAADLQKAGAALNSSTNAGTTANMMRALNSYQTAAKDYQTKASAEASAGADVKDAQGQLTGYLKGIQNTSKASSGSSKSISNAIDQLYKGVSGSLKKGTSQVASGAAKLAKNQKTLANGIQVISQNQHSLVLGLGKVENGNDTITKNLGSAKSGAQSLSNGLQSAVDGSNKVTNGIGSAKSGAKSLSNGLQSAVDGSNKITNGLKSAKTGAQKLHDGLDSGQKKLENSVKNRSERSSMMSQPVTANGSNKQGVNLTQVKNYGTGFAPYFIALGMWVGGLMLSMIMSVLNRRILMSSASSTSAVLASYIPMLCVSFLQAILLLLTIQFGLHMHVKYVLAFYLFGLLTSCCFIAIIQFFRASLGTTGMLLIVVLLMIQLCAAGGTFPIEAEPKIFQVIYPWVPITYVVHGFRMCMAGMSLHYLWQDIVALLIFTVAFLSFTILWARHRRTVVISEIHPAMKLG